MRLQPRRHGGLTPRRSRKRKATLHPITPGSEPPPAARTIKIDSNKTWARPSGTYCVVYAVATSATAGQFRNRANVDGRGTSTVVLGEATQGYTPGVDVSDGTWASLAIVYNNGETGLIVPWTDLPRGSGYTFQDELVEGSLDEIISSTRKDVPCWSDE